jgi:hypothetical protein
MENAQTFFGDTAIGFLSMLPIGAIAGWVAERVPESRNKISTNVLPALS